MGAADRKVDGKAAERSEELVGSCKHRRDYRKFLHHADGASERDHSTSATAMAAGREWGGA